MSRASSSRKRNARRPRVKGIHRVSRERASGEIVRHHYAWRGGPKFWTSEDGPSEGSPEYWALYDRAVARLDYSRGKFRELLRAFLGSREFEQLKPRTQKDYQRFIFGLPDGQSIDDEFGDAPLQAFNDPRIRRAAYEWRDRFSSPRVADHAKTVLHRIVAWGVDKSWLRANHVAGMSNLYRADRSDIVWTPEEIETFIEKAPLHTARAMILASETGLRPGDQILVQKTHIVTGLDGVRRIQITTGKRNRRVDIPVTPRLAEMIDGLPEEQTHLIVGSRGRPYQSRSSLSHAMTDVKKALQLREELHFYDARSFCVTRLVRAGVRLDELALHMGWSPSYAARMLDVYARMEGTSAARILDALENIS